MFLDRQSTLAFGCFGKEPTDTARVRGRTNGADAGRAALQADSRLATLAQLDGRNEPSDPMVYTPG